MGDAIINNFVDIIGRLKTNITEIKEINKLVKTELPTFLTTLNRLHSNLNSLSFIYRKEDAHYILFKHHLLKFSQIDTILCKINPIGDLLNTLSEIKYSKNCSTKMMNYLKLYVKYNTPKTISSRIRKYFKIIEDVLPTVINLTRTILGSAIRIKQPILRKAWMLAGENQLNDSSLPINIIQDNLYMLLQVEIGENTLDRTNKKAMYKNIINQITDDIDNRGATKGDGNISIAELNDLPDELMKTIDDIDIGIDIEDYKTGKVVPDIYSCCLFSITNSKVFLEQDDYSSSTKSDSTKGDDNESLYGDEDNYSARAFCDAYKLYIKNKKLKAKQKQKKKNQIKEQKQEEKEKEKEKETDIGEEDTENAIYEGLNYLFGSSDYIEESTKIPIIIDLDKENTIKYNEDKLPDIPCVKDYGNNFPKKKIYTIILKKPSEYDPKLNDETSILTNINFKIIAKDQEWGGTNHAQVRYQINNEKCIKAFTIDNNNKKNKYKFTINGCELNNYDKFKQKQQEIHIWLFCPPWSGWEASISSITYTLNYN